METVSSIEERYTRALNPERIDSKRKTGIWTVKVCAVAKNRWYFFDSAATSPDLPLKPFCGNLGVSLRFLLTVSQLVHCHTIFAKIIILPINDKGVVGCLIFLILCWFCRCWKDKHYSNIKLLKLPNGCRTNNEKRSIRPNEHNPVLEWRCLFQSRCSTDLKRSQSRDEPLPAHDDISLKILLLYGSF